MAISGMWFAFGLILLITVIIVVVIWQVFANQRAKAALARDEAYKKLAEQVSETQQQTVKDLAELKERIARIENVLSEVE